MAIIEVTGLTKTFTSRERASGIASSLRSFVAPRYQQREAVKPIDFVLEAGELLAFIGPNGAGKSTTIKMLTGILYPTAGHATVLGFNPWQQRQQLAYAIASVFGQKSQLWYHLPPQDTFNLLAHIYELDWAAYQRRRAFLIDVFGIEAYIRTPARKLSLGERMRCELAAALLHQPKLLFLDEPTIGLDVIAKQRIRDLIAQLNAEEGTSIFLTSHDAGDIEIICRRAIVINHGEIILDAPVSQLKREYLKTKRLELLLDVPASSVCLPDTSHEGERWHFRLLSEGSKESGIRVLKVEGRQLILEVDTARSPLEPIIAALLERSHIQDMTITDPPMEEIIAAIYQRQIEPQVIEEVRS
ncbi:ABC transporter ATP-binding protein [Tengunoibacter tsumagoiensis]|uniref:Sugar ABC transporter ATP-binding protein n=1 Tax=Tengunoibacter tsumagoiensis TaxID=2014871 RepID=A0A402A450_9CHLR|nr:ATP-binding cassette domain-containing protein [Tengunoibacter tsumagoiensis]GCE13765.1 sugar ABC transporter ATP-binding protein [Tengunoibacter tsumagoiensis]